MRKKARKTRVAKKRGSEKYKSINNFLRGKFRLDPNNMLKFRSMEGNTIVPPHIVSGFIASLFRRNLKMEIDEEVATKITVQLFALLGIMSIYNSDRKVCIHNLFQLHTFPDLIDENKKDENRYVFSVKINDRPTHLSSYLHRILFEKIIEKEVEEDKEVGIEDLFLSYFDGLISNSKEALEEIDSGL